MIKRRAKNKGFSLLELLIVVSISAILMTLALYSYSMVTRANVTKAANRFATALRTSRMQCMAKGMAAGAITVERVGDIIYYSIGPDGEKEMLCNASIIHFSKKYSDSSDGRDGAAALGSGESFQLKFTAAGNLKTAGVGGNPNNLFIFENGNKHMEVYIYLETGTIDVIGY